MNHSELWRHSFQTAKDFGSFVSNEFGSRNLQQTTTINIVVVASGFPGYTNQLEFVPNTNPFALELWTNDLDAARQRAERRIGLERNLVVHHAALHTFRFYPIDPFAFRLSEGVLVPYPYLPEIDYMMVSQESLDLGQVNNWFTLLSMLTSIPIALFQFVRVRLYSFLQIVPQRLLAALQELEIQLEQNNIDVFIEDRSSESEWLRGVL